MDLTNKQVPKDWEDGYILGNGDIGVVAYGEPSCLKFSLNKSDIWDNRVEERKSSYPAFQEIKELIIHKEWDRLKKVRKLYEKLYNKPYPQFLPVGELSLKSGNGLITNYQAKLDLDEGLSKTSFLQDGFPARVESFVSAQRNILAIRYISKFPGRINFRLLRKRNPLFPKPAYFATPYPGFKLSLPLELEYAVMVGIQGEKRKLELGKKNISFSLKADGKSIVIFLTIVSSNDTKEIISESEKNISFALSNGWEGLYQEHSLWWQKFWDVSSLKISNKKLEKQWYFEMYKMGSCCREGKRAPGLFGIWSNRESLSWHNDYHLDCNMQMQCWPLFTSNHLELVKPYIASLFNMLPRVKEETKAFYGFKGAKYPLTTTKEGRDLWGWITTSMWPGTSAWVAELFIWYYRYSKDETFARKIAYPVLQECVKFYKDFLTLENDRYVIFPSISPESGEGEEKEAFGRNPTIDIALLRQMAKGVIKIYDDLGIENQEKDFCKDLLERLPPYPTKDGVWIELEGRKFTHSHRHPAVLMPIYSTGEIDFSNPEERKVGLATYRFFIKRGQRLWCGFTEPWVAIVAARLGLGEECEKWLKVSLNSYRNINGMVSIFNLKKEMPQEFNPSAHCNRKVYEIDCGCQIATALNEMLLQSFEGIIKVFPAVPQSWDASFRNFRAEGGFLISAEIKNGKVKYISIKSLCKSNCSLANPWVRKAINLKRKKGIQRIKGERVLSVSLDEGEDIRLYP